jgi:hypothetical protein
MRPKILLLALLATAAAAVAMASSAAPDRAQLVARAVLPAATFAPGPPSG